MSRYRLVGPVRVQMRAADGSTEWKELGDATGVEVDIDVVDDENNPTSFIDNSGLTGEQVTKLFQLAEYWCMKNGLDDTLTMARWMVELRHCTPAVIERTVTLAAAMHRSGQWGQAEALIHDSRGVIYARTA